MEKKIRDFLDKYSRSIPWDNVPWNLCDESEPDLSEFPFLKYCHGRLLHCILRDDMNIVVQGTYCEYESGTKLWYDETGWCLYPKNWIELDTLINYLNSIQFFD